MRHTLTGVSFVHESTAETMEITMPLIRRNLERIGGRLQEQIVEMKKEYEDQDRKRNPQTKMQEQACYYLWQMADPH